MRKTAPWACSINKCACSRARQEPGPAWEATTLHCKQRQRPHKKRQPARQLRRASAALGGWRCQRVAWASRQRPRLLGDGRRAWQQNSGVWKSGVFRVQIRVEIPGTQQRLGEHRDSCK